MVEEWWKGGSGMMVDERVPPWISIMWDEAGLSFEMMRLRAKDAVTLRNYFTASISG